MLIVSMVLTVLAWGVLRNLWTAVRTGRGLLAYWTVAVAIHAAWALARATGGADSSLARDIAHGLATAWAVSCLFCFGGGSILLLMSLPGRFLFRARAGVQPIDLERRRFLGGAAFSAAAVTTGMTGTAQGMSRFTVRHQEVRLSGLPKQLDGFCIGQITDLHVGEFIDPDYLARAVDAMNEASCHLQVMTGDLIDNLDLLEPTFAALERCQAPHGMYAILGNHEKWRGLRPVKAAYRESAARGPVRLLVDESVRLEHEGAALRVVGVDYPMRQGSARTKEGRLAVMEDSARTAFQGIQPDETVLCLSHHPDFFPLAAARGARLTLSGHTHGGQIAFFGRPIFTPFDHMLGRYRRGDAHLYVSGGTGHWLPFRVGVPTEVTILTLRSA